MKRKRNQPAVKELSLDLAQDEVTAVYTPPPELLKAMQLESDKMRQANKDQVST